MERWKAAGKPREYPLGTAVFAMSARSMGRVLSRDEVKLRATVSAVLALIGGQGESGAETKED
ncbi:MAG: hypothetical protein HN350_02330 [Phycisphaerales bacterium]|jgi:hypothetical protein|nr:hypothetical protein [Phycisphaerales bacterium]